MKFLEELEKSGRIPMYLVSDDIELLAKLPDSKPSKRIIKTQKGIESIAMLKYIEKDKNHSWYREIYDRNINNLDSYAIFYRGNRITYREVFEKVNSLAKAMVDAGIDVNDEVPCCLANTPELIYVMLAANKIGARLNLFGANYDKTYIDSILSNSSKKMAFISDNYYDDLKDIMSQYHYDNKVLISLADSLPQNPSECPEYVPELDSYYHYDNKAKEYSDSDSSIVLFDDFVQAGKESKSCDFEYLGGLDDIFTITYTSGSTRNGFPKAMYHSNRSYIVGGIFNTLKLTNTPTIEGVRSMAHIHSDSNTDLITCISDTLMKGAEVAMEPEYSKESALDVMMINNPVLYVGTISHLVSAAKEYLINRRFNNVNSKRGLKRQLVTIAVGEKCSSGEEKFVNRFLRSARAGSNVEVKINNGLKVRIPYGPLSIGGGDTEHGGLFYTLQMLFKRLKYAYKGKNFNYGMDAVPFSVVTALKINSNGEYEECDYNEKGIIVANSITNMVGYKNNKQGTKSKIIRDNLGRDWISCNVLGYVNELGNPIFLGRMEDCVRLEDGMEFPLYAIDDLVCKDSKNILSCSSVVPDESDDMIVMNIEYSPISGKDNDRILESVQRRCELELPSSVYDKLYYRVIDNANSYPLTGSGKRNACALKRMPVDDVRKLSDLSSYQLDAKRLCFKRKHKC